MNTYSPGEVARMLGTSRKRVDSAARSLGIEHERGERVRFEAEQVRDLARRLGVTPPVPGLTRLESIVLAELSRRPLGLVSARAVARACALSPASATKVVASLRDKELVNVERETRALGRAREVQVIRANNRHPDWTSLLEHLAYVRPPEVPRRDNGRVPPHVRHAFWNLGNRQFAALDPHADGAFIADRALTTGDLALLAYAAAALPPEAWMEAAGARGRDPRDRTLARNLATQGPAMVEPRPELHSVLPPDTARTWAALGDFLPGPMVLYGGTAIAVHLHHRISRDLDFFFDQDDVDLEALRRRLEGIAPTAVSHADGDTLNAIVGATKVQFLRTRGQTPLEPPERVDGIPVAGLRDLLATKLKVVADRGELRDYFDIQTIERRTTLSVESGLVDYRARYGDQNENNLYAIARGLGYLDDVIDDPGLPASRTEIEAYWHARQPQIMRALESAGVAQPGVRNPDFIEMPAPESHDRNRGAVWVPPHTRNGRHVAGYWRRG